MNKLFAWVESNTARIVIATLLFVGVGTISVFIALIFDPRPWQIGYDSNGQIGDFFGGIMNPVVAFMALVWLVKGVELQKKELEGTRKILQDSEKNILKQVNISAITAIITSLNENIASLTNQRKDWEIELAKSPKLIDSNVMSSSDRYYSNKISECNKVIEQKRKEVDEYVVTLRGFLEPLPSMDSCSTSSQIPSTSPVPDVSSSAR